MKSRNLNAAQFADEIGVQRSSVSHILTGRNNASLDFILKVLQRYPTIDTDWLLTGKGGMMRKASIPVDENKKNERVVNHLGQSTSGETGDLFKQPVDFMDNNNDELMKEDESFPNKTRPNVVVTVKEDEVQTKTGEVINKINSARGVEKIVIFYSDKTFVDYQPER
jgi:transcriptional regulator with XRE-family HTH domain